MLETVENAENDLFLLPFMCMAISSLKIKKSNIGNCRKCRK